MTKAGVLEQVRVHVMGVVGGCTNPESAELLADGARVVFGNAATRVGVPWFRDGAGLVYEEAAAFVSAASIDASGDLVLTERVLLDGLTSTLGSAVMPVDAGPFSAGDIVFAVGGNPVVGAGGQRVEGSVGILGIDAATARAVGFLPLGPSSAIGLRFNGLQMPNGLAVADDGTIFVSDMPNTNPDADPLAPPLVPPAAYRIPQSAIAGLCAESGGADGVQRVVMPGFVNGLAWSPELGGCLAGSCSRAFDPVNGGIYVLDDDAFRDGVQPPPIASGFGPIDGIGCTRRGTLVVSNPLTGALGFVRADGSRGALVTDGWRPAMPADTNIVYPAVLDGEPALLVPDIAIGGPPGSGSVGLLDLEGL